MKVNKKRGKYGTFETYHDEIISKIITTTNPDIDKKISDN